MLFDRNNHCVKNLFAAAQRHRQLLKNYGITVTKGRNSSNYNSNTNYDADFEDEYRFSSEEEDFQLTVTHYKQENKLLLWGWYY